MCARYLGFVLLVWFPGVLYAQSAAQLCSAPRLKGGYFVPEQETYAHNTKLTYACDNGHKPAVEGWWATSTCQNGIWHHQPQCIVEEACIPPEIPNANYTKSSKGWYEEGSKIRITCDEGYESKDRDATAICVNGMWSSVPVCEKNVYACGEPPKIPHAVIIHQEYQELFAEDSEVEYECQDGYTAKEESKKKIYCIAGDWSEGPTCKSTNACGEPPKIPHAVIIHQENQELFAEDSEVEYECQDGYTAKEESKKKIYCIAGDWSEGPTCNRGTGGGHTTSPGSGRQPTAAANSCVLHPAEAAARNVLLSKTEYLTNGQQKYFPCVWTWDPHKSLVQCTNGRLTTSQCCRPHECQQRISS